MNMPYNAEGINAPGRSFDGVTSCAISAEPLEVNVIFTNREATAAALKATESFARGLGACIRLRAGIVVPVQLPLDQPLVSVEFFEKSLRELAGQPEPDGLERSIHLYVCRDWADTLLEVLKPNSMAVMGARKRWWPTAESRLARALRKEGIRVVLLYPREGRAVRVRTKRRNAERFLAVRAIARRFAKRDTTFNRQGFAR
jgi:hypothetical protein